MRIINKTNIETADLRALARRIAKVELNPEKKRGLILEYRNSRKQHRGEYWFDYHRAVVFFPKHDVDWWKVAMVTAHELHHANGRKGGRSNEYWMRRSVRYGWNEKTPEYYGWVNELEFRHRIVESKTTKKRKRTATPLEKAGRKLKQTEKNIANWETKLKRATNALKKYRRRLKYYERRVETLAESPQK